jgi:hypothetical protein
VPPRISNRIKSSSPVARLSLALYLDQSVLRSQERQGVARGFHWYEGVLGAVDEQGRRGDVAEDPERLEPEDLVEDRAPMPEAGVNWR